MSHGGPAKAENKAKLDAYFEKVAQTYEEDGGGIQNSICRNLLSLASEFNHPITESSVVLDNAAGPGILTGEVIKQCQPSEVPELHAADVSAAMIKVLNAKGWSEKYGVKAAVMDAQDLKYSDEMFTHIFMNLGIFLLPDPVEGAEQIYRTLKPGGIALVTTPRSTWWLSPFQKAQKRIKPDEEEFQGMLAPEWAKPEKVKALLEQAGFSAENIDVREAAADLGTVNFTNSQEMVRDIIVKGWNDDEIARFDKVLLEEFEVEANSGVPRQIGIWVGIAVKQR